MQYNIYLYRIYNISNVTVHSTPQYSTVKYNQ